MIKLASITATLLFSVSIGALAEGGNLWERKLDKIHTTDQKHVNPEGTHMDHTAVEHKRWQVEDVNTSADVQPPSHKLPVHMDHTAVEHKRWQVEDVDTNVDVQPPSH
jgi:hypothetical protein